MKKKHLSLPIKKNFTGVRSEKNKVQTTILYSINNISFIHSNLEKKNSQPPS